MVTVASKRLPGWEQRLAQLIEAARLRPYVLGEHDCFRLACRVIEALTGVDRWPEFAGSYSTPEGALIEIGRRARSFKKAGDWFFGVPAMDARLARRGDVVEFVEVETGEHHLGVVTGVNFVCLAQAGLVELPVLRHAVCAWRVG